MASTGSTAFVQLIPTYSPLYIFLAFVVAWGGAWTTLELLLRRTGGSGLLNVALLVGGGVAFGSTTFA